MTNARATDVQTGRLTPEATEDLFGHRDGAHEVVAAAANTAAIRIVNANAGRGKLPAVS
jgi:hypothetical protein